MTGWNFQYPQSDRRRCNQEGQRHWSESKVHFQYPQSDRRRCNAPMTCPEYAHNITFSILSRIGGVATNSKSRETPYTTSLSVSSVGSEALQQAAALARARPRQPLSVSSVGSEALQQAAALARARARQPLSVSSVGSEALQPKKPRPTTPHHLPFSILSRIGGVATMLKRTSPSPVQDFQYPQSDRRRCNHYLCQVFLCPQSPFSILSRIGGVATLTRRSGYRTSSSFQYPQSDRRRCNFGCGGGAAGDGSSPFSILSRIGGVATATRHLASPTLTSFQYPQSDRRRCNEPGFLEADEREAGFQYPQSDRRRCNDSSGRGPHRPASGLSVSSVGSEALQRC